MSKKLLNLFVLFLLILSLMSGCGLVKNVLMKELSVTEETKINKEEINTELVEEVSFEEVEIVDEFPEEYIDFLFEKVEEYSAAFREIDVQVAEYLADPSSVDLIYDNSWFIEMQEKYAPIHNAYDELQQVGVPEGYEEIHERILTGFYYATETEDILTKGLALKQFGPGKQFMPMLEKSSENISVGMKLIEEKADELRNKIENELNANQR